MTYRKIALLLLALSLGCGGGPGDGEEEARRNGPMPGPSPTVAPAAPTIVLEVDKMDGMPDLPETLTVGGRSISLHDIYAAAGLDLRVVRDQNNLPAAPSVRLADLHAMMTQNRSVPVPAGGALLHLLIVSRSAERPDDLGIMFDFGDKDVDDIPREAFAIYADKHRDLGGDHLAEMLLTAAHELAHCFNLHHPDWEGTNFDNDATIESYSMADTVRWQLSERSLQHLATHPLREVRFGRGNVPFGLITAAHRERHQEVPAESFDVFDPNAISTVSRGAPRAPSLRPISARDSARVLARENHPLRLELGAAKAEWTVGEPISVTVGLHNSGAQGVEVRPLLDPAYHFLNLEVRPPGSNTFVPFRPLLLREARGSGQLELAPGTSIHEEVKIFFGADGWWFTQEGRYDVRADFPTGSGEDRIQSGILTLTVRRPQTTASGRAAQLVLGKQQGLYLFFEGGDHLRSGAAELRKLVQDYPNSAQAPAARLALGIGALEPTIVGSAGAEPRLEVAQNYLRNILKSDLPPEALVRAQATLAEELEGAGRKTAAQDVRQATVEELRNEESIAAHIDEVLAGRVPTAATDEQEDPPLPRR